MRNYNRPDQVANTVLDDLVDLLNHRFPEDEPLSAEYSLYIYTYYLSFSRSHSPFLILVVFLL